MNADKKTDKTLEEMEKQIGRVYTQAWGELNDQVDTYFSNLSKREADLKKAIADGKAYITPGMTEDEYLKQWKLNQEARGEDFIKLRDLCAERATNANVVAAAYINDKTPGVYSLNYNHTSYELEGDSGLSYAPYQDENTIRELVNGGNHSEFKIYGSTGEPHYFNPSIDVPRDYAWNQKRIQNALTSGIIQGKSTKRIADDFYHVMGNNKAAAIRNARTAVTSAQNAGKLDSMMKAKEMGLDVAKMWVSILDGRTRDSHQHLDGEVVELEETFSNGLTNPGDRNGIPGEVYNCRCRMRRVFRGINDDMSNRKRWTEDVDENGDRVFFNGTYDEWVAKKQGKTTAKEQLEKYTPCKTVKEAEEYAKRFANNVSYKGLSVDHANVINEKLLDLQQKYSWKPLEKIEVNGRGSRQMAASYDELLINKKQIGTILDEKESYNSLRERYKNYVKQIEDEFSETGIPKSYQKKIRQIEKSLKFDRWCVSDQFDNNGDAIRNTLAHEFGHVISDQKTGIINREYANDEYFSENLRQTRKKIVEMKKQAEKDGFIYQVSEYSKTNKDEFFAECFAMYDAGNYLPDYIKDVIEEVLALG